ncbi:MAG: serine hydrolase [Pseudomonadota bacterium]
MLVSHRGKLIAERYARPVSAHTPMQSWSMNKSLMATWIGMQAERGLLDVDRPLAPQLKSEDAALAAKLDSALNLGHLLHMESGFDFLEEYGPGSDVTRMLYSEPGAWRVAAANGHARQPGRAFYYSSGDTNLASWFWQRSLEEPYIAWVQREFAEPLELGAIVAEHDATGTQIGSSYTFMTARDWLRVGEFWLAAFQGRSPLLSADWMRDAVTPRPSATDGNYGRGFWLNTQRIDYPLLPEDLFYAAGHNGQYVMIFPRQELVVVRLGLTYGAGAVNGVEALAAAVLSAVSNERMASN